MCGSAHGFMWSLWARNPGVMLFPAQRYRSAAWRGAGTEPLTQRCLGPLSPWTCALLLSACGQAAELPKSWGSQISFCALARLGGSEHLGFLLPKPAPILLRFEVIAHLPQNGCSPPNCSQHLMLSSDTLAFIMWSYTLKCGEFWCSTNSKCPPFSAAAGEGSMVAKPPDLLRSWLCLGHYSWVLRDQGSPWPKLNSSGFPAGFISLTSYTWRLLTVCGTAEHSSEVKAAC